MDPLFGQGSLTAHTHPVDLGLSTFAAGRPRAVHPRPPWTWGPTYVGFCFLFVRVHYPRHPEDLGAHVYFILAGGRGAVHPLHPCGPG